MQAIYPLSASLKDAAALSPKAKRSQGHTATTCDIPRALHLTTEILTITLALELPPASNDRGRMAQSLACLYSGAFKNLPPPPAKPSTTVLDLEPLYILKRKKYRTESKG